MTLSAKQGKTWLCPRCSHRNEWRGTSRKCQGCGKMTRRKKRVPVHARTLRDDSYERYVEVNKAIHGAIVQSLGFSAQDCGCCGRHKPEHGKHQREHDHRSGLPRGLACYRCNHQLLRNHTLETARMIVAYFERVEEYYRAMGTEPNRLD